MANIELDGGNKKITVDSGDLTLDIPGDIILDADGGDVVFADGGTNLLKVTNSSSDVVLQPQVDAKDIIFKQYDGRNLLEINDGGYVAIANGATGPGQLRLYEDTDNGTNYSAFQVGTQSGDITYTLPTADGSNGHALTTNGSGTLSWASAGTTYAGIDDQSSSNDDQLTITDTAVIINEDSDSIDFRVESNGDTHCLMVDGSGDKVGIGEDVPEGKLHVMTGDASVGPNANADELVVEGSGHAGMSILSGTSSTGTIYFGDSGDDDRGSIIYDHSEDALEISVVGAEAMRINSDKNMGVGTNDPGSARLNVQINSGQLYYGKNDTSGQFAVSYQGVISATNTTVASISDERLKKDIADFSGGLNIVKAMKPRTYKWKNPQYHNDKDDTQYGFVAQELLTISDAEKMNIVIVDDANFMMYENEKDLLPDGKANISGYQEKDAIYVSAIKELSAKVDTLETENTALKARVKTLEDA